MIHATLSFERLTRLAETGRFDTLIDEILRYGRRVPLPVRLALGDEAHADLCGLAVAIRRITEVTHRPNEHARFLLAELFDRLEQRSGRLGVTPAAVVLRALLTVQDQLAALPAGSNPLDTADRVRLARHIDDACHALFLARLAAEGRGSDGLLGEPLESAIALWQLGERVDLVEIIRPAEIAFALRHGVERRSPGVDELLHFTGSAGRIAA